MVENGSAAGVTPHKRAIGQQGAIKTVSMLLKVAKAKRAQPLVVVFHAFGVRKEYSSRFLNAEGGYSPDDSAMRTRTLPTLCPVSA